MENLKDTYLNLSSKRDTITGKFLLTNAEIDSINNGEIKAVWINDSYYTIEPANYTKWYSQEHFLTELKLTKCDADIK